MTGHGRSGDNQVVITGLRFAVEPASQSADDGLGGDRHGGAVEGRVVGLEHVVEFHPAYHMRTIRAPVRTFELLWVITTPIGEVMTHNNEKQLLCAGGSRSFGTGRRSPSRALSFPGRGASGRK